MSLDNVVAIAAAARGHAELFIFGLLLTIPLIVFGSQLILKLIARFPILVWAGAGLLGWIAGEMMLSDKVVLEYLAGTAPEMVEKVEDPDDPVGLKAAPTPHYIAATIGAAFVIAFGWIWKSRRGARTAESGSHG
jgi:predicted tellurium resistance membrane protein TerC